MRGNQSPQQTIESFPVSVKVLLWIFSSLGQSIVIIPLFIVFSNCIFIKCCPNDSGKKSTSKIINASDVPFVLAGIVGWFLLLSILNHVACFSACCSRQFWERFNYTFAARFWTSLDNVFSSIAFLYFVYRGYLRFVRVSSVAARFCSSLCEFCQLLQFHCLPFALAHCSHGDVFLFIYLILSQVPFHFMGAFTWLGLEFTISSLTIFYHFFLCFLHREIDESASTYHRGCRFVLPIYRSCLVMSFLVGFLKFIAPN